ncbi:ABC transporter substrate-binding protein [Bordetella bronchiseptica]|uniref:ABC transporter substrate-binding protein n=1 Tax=Bordetella bronchiseptica TaxID=518 RepID=UPI0004619D69|nr:ABC transporter substrate-binding protein [Bordetella bronchiseptica]AWP75480.1 ABC transporter substrate-binding protein [Bordetella bronchiseptica]KDB98013.1 NMT1/THI5-like protein [Bordetella bronchiseptica D993]KDC03937.1 NMT1/THI5-like protein [Bordetella bronchiseptica E010]KDD34270.1 NMT1/THI5-like protein [Bordetella bronchiseptica MBORD839]KFJ67160.1 bacterial extracellular solute-binding s, 3 family protein [Bordetella bronchiseptica]
MMNPQRRTLLKTGALAAAMAGIGIPSLARARDKVRVGYLHTPAVDGQIWTGQQTGAFAKHGLDLELIQFTTGLELFQAMIGGSLDMLSTGAVVSNFPARGQGKVFLVNNIEYATAQLWVREDAGIKTLADLKGKKISTTTGTTAHVFLDRALRSVGLQAGKDVQIVNQRMAEAVTSFISGAVPAVALWVPFDVTIRQKLPGARKLLDASAFYPEAAIVGGWAARNDYYDKNPKIINALIQAWAETNDYLLSHTDEALVALQKNHYQQVPLPDLKEQFKASKYFTAAEWRQRYADGTVTRWLQQVTDFFVQSANIAQPVPAERYFDPKPYLKAVRA